MFGQVEWSFKLAISIWEIFWAHWTIRNFPEPIKNSKNETDSGIGVFDPALRTGERTAEEDRAFSAGLKAVNLWYGYNLVEKWLLTAKPGGAPDTMLAYGQRGWPLFERAICELQSDFRHLLDLGLLTAEANYDAIHDACAVAKRAFLTSPADFTAALEKVTFTNGADKPFVSKKYAQTIEEVFG